MDRKEAERDGQELPVCGCIRPGSDPQSGLTRQRRPLSCGCILEPGSEGSDNRDQFDVLHKPGTERISPLFVPMMNGNMAAGLSP
jgi:3-oxoacyl-(acyl-carrier-protein) synthase